MVELTFYKVYWCAHHGHPALALNVAESDQCLVLALGTEDAMALAATHMPGPSSTSRTYGLLADVVIELGGQLTAVQLRIGTDAVVRSFLHLNGPRGSTIVPAYIVDGITLALRQGLPLWMTEADFTTFSEMAAAHAPAPAHQGLEPYRSLVESLDLDGFGGMRH